MNNFSRVGLLLGLAALESTLKCQYGTNQSACNGRPLRSTTNNTVLVLFIIQCVEQTSVMYVRSSFYAHYLAGYGGEVRL
jgi:hypothetical protein